MQEIWKDIVGYEGYYQISNFGKIRSVDRKIYYIGANQHSHYQRSQIIKGKIVKQQKNNSGYQKIMLSIDNKRTIHLVHRLVAQAFIPNPSQKPEVNHKDGNKQNNCVDNLEWTTRAENMQHAVENNLKTSSEYQKQIARNICIHTKSKKINQYDKEGNFIKTWNSIAEASRELKKSRSKISECCNKHKKSAYGYIWQFVN